MYGGGYGSSYGGMYGSRYGMGGMGMGMGMGGGMGMGMGGMDQQYSWLHSIQHFTSSLGYLTEVSGWGLHWCFFSCNAVNCSPEICDRERGLVYGR